MSTNDRMHTPGPWQIMDDYTREGGLTIIGNVDGEYFTDSPSPVMSYEFVAKLEDEYGETHERTAANRRLILAAPDLYEALRAARDAVEGHFDDSCDVCREAIDMIQAALAKAEGRS